MVAQDQTLPPWQVAQHSQCVRLPTAGEVTQNPDRVTFPHHFAPVVGDGGVMVNPVIEATEASHLGMTQVQVSGEELPHTDHFPLCRYMSRMSSRFVALIAMRLAISASPALILPFFSSLAMRFMRFLAIPTSASLPRRCQRSPRGHPQSGVEPRGCGSDAWATCPRRGPGQPRARSHGAMWKPTSQVCGGMPGPGAARSWRFRTGQGDRRLAPT